MRTPTDRCVMHSYPGMVAIVTARYEGEQNVMAAGWHSWISIVPPIYGVAVAKERHTHRLMERSRVFGINFLPAEKSEWIQQVGVASGKTVPKFEAWEIGYEEGCTVDVPILRDAYIAYECRVIDIRSYGDHDWFVGTISQFYRDDDLFLENGLPKLARLHIPLYLGRSTYAVLDDRARLKKHYVEKEIE